MGDRVSTVVKMLCYKSEGRCFDSSWCHWQKNPSDRTMTLGSSQHPTEMSSRSIFWGVKGGWYVRLKTLPTSCEVVTKSRNLKFLETSGPLQACNGTALPLHRKCRLFATKRFKFVRSGISTKMPRGFMWHSLSHNFRSDIITSWYGQLIVSFSFTSNRVRQVFTWLVVHSRRHLFVSGLCWSQPQMNSPILYVMQNTTLFWI